MPGKITITLDENQRINIESELQGQELYQALVAYSAHLAARIKNPNDFPILMKSAAEDALRLLKETRSKQN